MSNKLQFYHPLNIFYLLASQLKLRKNLVISNKHFAHTRAIENSL